MWAPLAEKGINKNKIIFSSKNLGFMGPFVKLRGWDVTSLCMQ